MDQKQILRFLQSLVFIPALSTTIGLGAINASSDIPTKATETAVASQQFNNDDSDNFLISSILENSHIFSDAMIKNARARKIDAYFNRRGLPLAGWGKKMVEEAIENDIDWRLMPAIAMRESTGGKFDCETASFNPFGWGSCSISFQSYNEAIEVIAKNLGGKNHKTARYYDGELSEVLDNYNGRAVEGYSDQVMAIMKKISPEA